MHIPPILLLKAQRTEYCTTPFIPENGKEVNHAHIFTSFKINSKWRTSCNENTPFHGSLFFYLHYNIYDHDLDAKLTRSYLTALFKYNVMQMRKGSCEKGY